MLTLPWFNLPYGGMDGVALGQPYQTSTPRPPSEPLTHLEATLLGSNEAPRVDTGAYGRAILSLTEDQSELAYRITVADIDNITAAHIHLGNVGSSGSVVLTLYDGAGPFDPDNPLAGTLTLTSSQATNLLAGRFYINIHTTDFPDGEIRGQIVPSTTVSRYEAHLDGDKEVPAVDTTATGQAMLFLSDDEERLTYRVSVENIENITATHIHRGQPGENGPIIFDLFDGTGTFDSANPITGTLTILASDVSDLRDGNYYVNVHTDDHPDGEIRGQVGPQQQYQALQARLTGDEEAPPVATGAGGQATFVLSADQTQLSYRVTAENIEDVTAVHIHRGGPGENGPILFELFDGAGTFDPDNPISGAVEMSATDVDELLSGDLYVNAHTDEHPDGEIRGQIIAFTPADTYRAGLSGANEAPPVTTDATGNAAFTLDPSSTELSYLITVADIQNITLAHIHRGPAGQNGPVAHTLFDGAGAFDPNNPLAGNLDLAPADLLDLLTGYYYVNVHTAQHPNGEIRGQIEPAPAYQTFIAMMRGENMVPPVATAAIGQAVFVLEEDEDTGDILLHFRVSVQNIDNITFAIIHRGLLGENGPVVENVYDGTGTFDPTNPVSGTLTLTQAERDDLLAGNYHLQIHTTDHTEGEIRGQITAFTPTGTYEANLSGVNEAPPVTSAAVGDGTFILDPGLTHMSYLVSVADIQNITAAHIHQGPAGQNGPIAHTLFGGAGTFDPTHPLVGNINLGASDLADLLGGFYYVNVHTAAHAPGEIRGQIEPRRFETFKASMNGSSAAPLVATEATGEALFVLDEERMMLHYRISVRGIENITFAFIHVGAPGQTGPLAHEIYNGTGAFDADNPLSGSLDLTEAELAYLRVGMYYVQLHSTENPGGDIRGQIVPFTPTGSYRAKLSGADEVPPVSTNATGLATFTFDPSFTHLGFVVTVADTGNITQAHIHRGPAGQNGPIAHTLFDGTGSFDPTHPLAGNVTLSATDLADMLGGFHYVNVHTTQHPAGEIRGQIGPRVFGTFKALLTGRAMVPSVDTDATGQAVFVLDEDQMVLHYRINVSGIDSVTFAFIHRGLPGEEGPLAHQIYDGSGVFDSDNPLSGSLELEETDVANLLAGRYNIVLHTTEHPGGEIRGQITPFTPASSHVAALSGANEAPPVTTSATGQATFTLDPGATHVSYVVTVAGIQNITAAHIHRAPVGENGPVVHTLFDGSGAFDPTHPLAGNVTLSASDLADLLGGFYYVNVHTTQHPSGETRGQIGPRGFRAFRSLLSGSSMAPPVDTDATGEALLVLDEEQMVLHYRVSVREIGNITFAIIHRGLPGENGPVVENIYDGTGLFDPDNPLRGSIELDESEVADLLAGRYYVALHTTDRPEGEIRGQITAYTPPNTYEAHLRGVWEVPPVTTNASGQATFNLDPSLANVSFVVTVADIQNITATHIHRAPVGQNGPVVHTLFDGSGTFDATHPLAGNVTLSATDLADLLGGLHYVNVHTTQHPAGEIRGQLGPRYTIRVFVPLISRP
ncbi:MAG: CHRD domain-containing protein [Anaerolineae bacterium]